MINHFDSFLDMWNAYCPDRAIYNDANTVKTAINGLVESQYAAKSAIDACYYLRGRYNELAQKDQDVSTVRAALIDADKVWKQDKEKALNDIAEFRNLIHSEFDALQAEYDSAADNPQLQQSVKSKVRCLMEQQQRVANSWLGSKQLFGENAYEVIDPPDSMNVYTDFSKTNSPTFSSKEEAERYYSSRKG